MIIKKQLVDFIKILKLPYCIINKNGYFTEVNELYCELYEYTPSELLGSHFTKVFSKNFYSEYHESKGHAQEFFFNSFKKYSTFHKHPIPYGVKTKSGKDFDIYTVSLDFSDENGEEYRLAVDCVEEDSVNKLKPKSINSDFNRTSFTSIDFLSKEIDKFVIFHGEPKFSLFNFRVLNQNINSDSMTKFYNILFENMRKIFGDRSIISILGSHHFIVFLKDIVTKDQLEKKALQLINFFSTPIKIDNHFIKESVRIGVTFYEGKGLSLENLFNEAELALKYAKVDDFLIYSDSIKKRLDEEFKLNSIIFNAYKNNEFIPHYQPYYSIETDEMVGMEALMRLESKEHGVIYPNKFIPVLENTYFIINVEKRMIEHIFMTIKKWVKEGFEIVPVSINLSPLQFKNYEFIEFLKETINKYMVNPKNICFEITESIFIENIATTKYILEELREIGFKISIDDFGTGYSSLQYLNEFPADNLKIDISFIKGLDKSKNNQAIVSAIISISKHFELKTICEGVETESELSIIRKLGADIVQGYYKSKPVNEEKIMNLLKKIEY